MVQRVTTVAFEGIEARAVDVQVQVAPGLPAFNVVGLPDKAVSEARERVRSALIASGLALPGRRITVNLAPADLPKEGRSRTSAQPAPVVFRISSRCSCRHLPLSLSDT
jgi:magnesium chelatase family protein